MAIQNTDNLIVNRGGADYKAPVSDLKIPSKTSELVNDGGYITADQVDIPEKLSELENDSGFITADSVPTDTVELANSAGYITQDTVPEDLSELNNDVGFITLGQAADVAPVQKVAGRTGEVVLTTDDVSGLADVATSGAYADISGTPTIPTKVSDIANDVGYITETQSVDAAPLQTVAGRSGDVTLTASDVGGLSLVATSGSYTNLSDKPVIPADTSDLTNTAGFITADALPEDLGDLTNNAGYALTSEIPTDNADLANGAGYLTQDDIAGLDQALVFKGTIDATLFYPDSVSAGDVWSNTTAGTADSQWTGLTTVSEGDLLARGDNAWAVVGASTIPELDDYVKKNDPITSLNNDAGFITSADVPTDVGSFNNDIGYVTASQLPADLGDLTNNAGFALSSEIPTNVSDLANDASYATVSQIPVDNADLNNGAGYATVSQIPTDNNDLANGANYITATEAPVQSVNGATGDVVLTTNNLVNDSGFITLSEVPAPPVTSVNGETGDVTFIIPTDNVELANGAGYITASEVPDAPVQSVNGETGEVVITIPTDNADLDNGANYITQAEAPVQSVNGETGTVVINIPTDNVQLLNGAGYLTADDIDDTVQLLNFQGTIDATSEYPADAPAKGDVWSNTGTGAADSQWISLTDVEDGDLLAFVDPGWVVIGENVTVALDKFIEKSPAGQASQNIDGPLTIGTDKVTMDMAGAVTATGFIGDGSQLTNLPIEEKTVGFLDVIDTAPTDAIVGSIYIQQTAEDDGWEDNCQENCYKAWDQCYEEGGDPMDCNAAYVACLNSCDDFFTLAEAEAASTRILERKKRDALGNIADASFDGIAGEFVADGDYIFFGPDSKWHKSPVPDDVDLSEYARLDGATFVGDVSFKTIFEEETIKITHRDSGGKPPRLTFLPDPSGKRGEIDREHTAFYGSGDQRIQVSSGGITISNSAGDRNIQIVGGDASITAHKFIGNGDATFAGEVTMPVLRTTNNAFVLSETTVAKGGVIRLSAGSADAYTAINITNSALETVGKFTTFGDNVKLDLGKGTPSITLNSNGGSAEFAGDVTVKPTTSGWWGAGGVVVGQGGYLYISQHTDTASNQLFKLNNPNLGGDVAIFEADGSATLKGNINVGTPTYGGAGVGHLYLSISDTGGTYYAYKSNEGNLDRDEESFLRFYSAADASTSKTEKINFMTDGSATFAGTITGSAPVGYQGGEVRVYLDYSSPIASANGGIHLSYDNTTKESLITAGSDGSTPPSLGFAFPRGGQEPKDNVDITFSEGGSATFAGNVFIGDDCNISGNDGSANFAGGDIQLLDGGSATFAKSVQAEYYTAIQDDGNSAVFRGTYTGSPNPYNTVIYGDGSADFARGLWCSKTEGNGYLNITQNTGNEIAFNIINDGNNTVYISAAGSATFAGTVTVNGSRPLVLNEGETDELDVKDRLTKANTALQTLKTAAAAAVDFAELKAAIATALADI